MATLFGMFPFLRKPYADAGYQGPKFQAALRARGCTRVHWLADADNAPARRLYDAVAENSGRLRYEIALA